VGGTLHFSFPPTTPLVYSVWGVSIMFYI
jgi:hypothetical protein